MGACRPLDIGVAKSHRESRAGHQHLVTPFDRGTLLAIIEPMGRGEEAARASGLAAASLRERPEDSPAVLLWRCHEALQGSCGAAMSLALFDDRRSVMTWLGVGNTWGGLFFANPLALPSRWEILPRSGVVGVRLPPPYPAAVTVRPYDTLVLATSGIRNAAITELPSSTSAQRLAEELLARHRTGLDEAAVLVARYGVTDGAPRPDG